jgi:putative transposase
MVSIGCSGGSVKGVLARLLPAKQIEQVAQDCGYRWRERKLGPVLTIHLWIMQVLLANLSLTQIRHLHPLGVSVSGFCQAKLRLPLQLLARLNEYLLEQLHPLGKTAPPLWHEHRVFGGDGVCYYTPDTPALRKRFGSKKPFGYPLLRVLTLFDLSSGAMLHQIPMPHRRQEAPLVARLLKHLCPGDVLILDRAFASYVNACAARVAGVELLIRLKRCLWSKPGTRRTILQSLGKHDKLVCWKKPKERTMLSLSRWSKLPEQLILRQISVFVNKRGYRTRRITVITTLLDPQRYPAAEIAQLYARRWEVETSFRHLKATLDLEMLRSQSIVGVKKELLIRAIAYNLVRSTMQQAAMQLKVTTSRVSFVDTLHWLLLSAQEDLRRIIINPVRNRRSEPRCLKRQPKHYLPLNCKPNNYPRKAA